MTILNTERATELGADGATSSSATAGEDGNPPRSGWAPSVFFQDSATDEGDKNEAGSSTEEERWAELAARARKDWAEENPF